MNPGRESLNSVEVDKTDWVSSRDASRDAELNRIANTDVAEGLGSCLQDFCWDDSQNRTIGCAL